VIKIWEDENRDSKARGKDGEANEKTEQPFAANRIHFQDALTKAERSELSCEGKRVNG
jgi:hypothetical protein